MTGAPLYLRPKRRLSRCSTAGPGGFIRSRLPQYGDLGIRNQPAYAMQVAGRAWVLAADSRIRTAVQSHAVRSRWRLKQWMLP